MIFLSDDYLVKYQDSLGYLIGRAISEQFSYDFIEKSISYSKEFMEFELSNPIDIAFSSMQKLYVSIFPISISSDFEYDPFGIFGWLGYAYINLFLKLQITFETLFIIFPLEEAIKSYGIYHEMDITNLISNIKEKVKYSYLDMIMTYKGFSTNKLANRSGISFATIQALRYNKRNISKLESSKILALSRALNVKMESLLSNIRLDCA